MQTMNVREFRNTIPHLKETLAREHELVLVSRGEAVARIYPAEQPKRLQSLKWLRDMAGTIQPDSTADIRAERNRRGT
ncbi:MAG: type II toxin-antitoxin system Phd/YefM family antitoxin [Polaromonas sp.]|jgi:antitoxin (DNA-binding transcriptional repressor) of toxin-antitoxin stability system